jgi:hypothetical protein
MPSSPVPERDFPIPRQLVIAFREGSVFLPQQIEVNMIQYLFSISTGRSGSKYLSGLLEHAEGVAAVHEAEPVMNSWPMRKFLAGKPAQMEALMPEKMAAIEADKGEADLYVETNHCFIKGYGWLIPQYIAHSKIGVVLIKREKEKIVNSYYRIGCYPLSSFGRSFLMTPLMRNPLCKISLKDRLLYWPLSHLARFIRHRYIQKLFSLPVPAFIENYDKRMLGWYVEETLAQGERFKAEFPDIKVFETTIEQLNDMEVIEEMFRFFGLNIEFKASVEEVIGVPRNLKRFKK